MSVPAAYAQHAGSQLLQVQQHVADMQAQDIPVALAKCLHGLLSMLQTFNTVPNTASTAADAQQDPGRGPADACQQQQQQMEATGLYVQCCLCMTKRACQLATAGQGVLQDVAGLLQDQLQRSDSLVTAIFCQHCNLLLQDALSLDVLLRIVPLLRTEQQAAVYKAFLQCIAEPLDTGAREPQAVTSLTQHCHRHLEQFVLSDPVLPSHPGGPVLPNSDPCPRADSHNGCQVLPNVGPNPRPDSHFDCHEARVRVGLQLPALLALSLALPQWTSTVRSLKGVAASACTGGPEDQEEDVRQRVARLGGIVKNLVEVFLNSLMTQPETLSPILGNCLTSEGCTAPGKGSMSSSLESRLSHQTMAVVLHLLALHSALQAADKAGKTKAVRDPVFISLSGAHGLLKFAVQLLSEKAGSKPQRRRSRHVTNRASDMTPALDAHLAAYLLTLVGHIIEGGSFKEEEQLGLASQAVTVYKLIRQDGVFSSRSTFQSTEEMLAEVLQDNPDHYVDDASPAEALTHSPADPLASTPSAPPKPNPVPALCSSSSASARRRILTADEIAHKRQHQRALLEAALCDQQQLKAHVMTACQLIDPSMGYAGTTAANAGASTYVIGSACLVLLGHLVGCFAQDFAPSPVLVEAYLSLLGLVTAAGHHEQCTLTPAGHHEHCTLTPGKASTPPHKVLSDALQAFVAKIPLPTLKLPTVKSLLKMVLDPLPDSDSAAMGAATLWAVVQGCGVGPGGVTWPDWAQCVSEAWAHAWMYKISTRQRRTASCEDQRIQMQTPWAARMSYLHWFNWQLTFSEYAQLLKVCMLDAYGMDLVAVTSCMLQNYEDWPDSSTSNVEDLRGTTASFKEQNAALLAQLMPQDDMLDMPLQQAALHDALGSAIQQHCCIVGQDSSDRQDSASEAGSDAYTDDSWSESESEVSGVFESLKASCCESTPKAAGFARQKVAKKSANPFIQAAMAEARQSCTNSCQDLEGDCGSYSDLEDFIVCKPDRSYMSLFSKHYKYSALG
ncbi:hypothetical protein WJX82_004172 [Trebouxia sp. C0006]